MPDTYVIANPRAGKGNVGRDWERLLAALHRAGLDAVGDLTQHAGHAVDLARTARKEQVRLVVAAGGDGTVHEVVNGLLADGPGEGVPMLGIVPLGSGRDYARSFDIPGDLEGAVARLASEDPAMPVDVGEVRYQGGQGEETRLFMNIAEVGFGPEVVERAARLPRRLGSAVYFAAFWLALPGFRRPRSEVLAGEERIEETMMNLVVAHGKVFGGGMRIAPDADPSDGLFDVQVHAASKLDYARTIPKVYKGTHIPHPKIKQARSARLEVRCDPPALIEADGEVLGRTPATFTVLPSALRLKA